MAIDATDATEKIAWLEKAVSLGEPEAMGMLAGRLWSGWNVSPDKARAKLLWREAAELGEPFAQCSFAEKCCAENSLEQLEWLRRSAAQVCSNGFGDRQRKIVQALCSFWQILSARSFVNLIRANRGDLCLKLVLQSRA